MNFKIITNKVKRKRVKRNHEAAESLEELLNAATFVGKPKNDLEREFLKHVCKVYNEIIEELNNYMALIGERCDYEKEKEK